MTSLNKIEKLKAAVKAANRLAFDAGSWTTESLAPPSAWVEYEEAVASANAARAALAEALKE